MQTSFLIIFKIAISFTVLFVLPFILVTPKIFRQRDKLFQIYISMIIGLFSSVALVYLLAIFNVFNKINFLISYGSIILVSNLYFLRQRKHWRISFKLRITSSFVLLLFAFAIGSYMRLYDPLKHISLGSGDFYRHLWFLKETADGYIFSSYPKSYHIILVLINFVSNIDSYALARFAGAFFGIISIGAVYCLMRQVFGKKAAVFTTLFYSGFTLFNYLTIEQTGLFAQGFGFVLIPFVIYFALELVNNFKEGAFRRRNILLFIFIVFLLSLITPYAMLQMSYVLYFLLFFSIAFHSGIREHIIRFFKNVTVLIILFSLGMLIVLSYYTVVIREVRGQKIRVPAYDESKIVRLVEEGESKSKAMKESAILANWTTHKWVIIRALLRIKRFRVPVEFPLSIGMYAGLLLSFFLLVFSIIKRRLELFAISIFIFLFGVSTITGILEFPLYQGRAGWYFMLGSIWLGGIIVKKFYDQELMRDIFHMLKRVIPLRITNKAKNIKESKASLIYVILTSSALVSYLVIIWAWGLLRLNPIRDTSLLLLIPITIFIFSRKKRDILSGERVPYGFPEKARLYLSLHKTLVLTVVLVAMLYPLPEPPEYNFRYYHRSTNEDDFVKVVQKVKDKYPLSEVKMFFDDDIVRHATSKTKNMVYPQNIKIAKTEDILSRIGDKRYNFLFLDYREEKLESLKNIRETIFMDKEQYSNVRVFYDSEKIVVYLLEN
ncbi:hypothetical protein ES702_00030 [subsurface metagenome]